MLDSINNQVHPSLEMAVEDDLIRKKTSKSVLRSLRNNKSGDPYKLLEALSLKQQKAFLTFVKKNPTYRHWFPIFVTLLGTGMRITECTGLTWNDVDFRSNTISVNHSLTYQVIDGKAVFHITAPKTATGARTIPIMFDEVTEQLRTLYETRKDTDKEPDFVLDGYSGFVFRDPSGELLSTHCVNRMIKCIQIDYNKQECDQAELEARETELLPHFSVHVLRHTFYTRLCENTSDVKFIRQIMGHADHSTTMDIYTHLTEEGVQQKVKALKNKISLM